MTSNAIDAVLVGSDAVDEETGEILVFPEDCTDGPERIAWLTHMHREADREVKAWEVEKGKWARFLARAVAEAGMKSFKSDYGSVVSVAATTVRKAPATNVARAATEELITAEKAYELLVRAAKELDPDEVEKWIGEQPEEDRKILRIALITLDPRRGYTYTREPAKPSARRNS